MTLRVLSLDGERPLSGAFGGGRYWARTSDRSLSNQGERSTRFARGKRSISKQHRDHTGDAFRGNYGLGDPLG